MTSPGPRTDPAGAAFRGGAPEAIGSVLSRVMRGHGPAARRRRSAVAEAWDAAVTAVYGAGAPAVAAETRPSTLQHGVLTVEVRSPPLLAEIAGFRRDELLARILEAEPSGRVTGLRFRPGVF